MKKRVALITLFVLSVTFLSSVYAQEEMSFERIEGRLPRGEDMKRFGKYRGGMYVSPKDFAAYNEDEKAAWREMQSFKIKHEISDELALAAAIAIGLAALGGALGQGKVAASAMEGIARNPEAGSKMFTPLMISLALIESLVIYALVIAFLLQAKM